MMTINEQILYNARKFLGMQEIKGNQGFKNAQLQALMEKYGWQKGWAWCSVFAEMVWSEAYENYNKPMIKVIEKLFSAGAVKTYNNFKTSEFGIYNYPVVGAVVIWQNYRDGKPHWTGHAGIVVKIYSDDSDKFESIEGNTNTSGGREGIEVGRQVRMINFEPKQKGLVLKGYYLEQVENITTWH